MIRPVSSDGRIETGGAFTPILRPRVVERIFAAASQRIVLIIAPAGYGKSVALHQYLSAVSESWARFDIKPEHTNLLGFLRGFAEAVHAIAPDARQTLPEAYEKSRSSALGSEDLASWLLAHIKSFSGIIAVDDFHITESDPEITKFLVRLIERTRGRVRWVIASRSSLDLPVGSWLAYGDTDLAIDEFDLRFNLEEAQQAAKASRVAVRGDELEEILAMTDGWPTALSFALRSSTRSVDLRNVAATTRDLIYRYLAEQVYAGLSHDEQELLHAAVYLDEISIEALRELGYSKAKAMVESLRGKVAFIYPDRPGVYRCHDLFRDFVKNQVELQGDQYVDSTIRRVAIAQEGTKRPWSALRLYIEVGAIDEILRIVETMAFELVEQGHGDAVYAAVEKLPIDLRATNAIVLGLRGIAEANRGNLDKAESLLARAVSHSTNEDLKSDLGARLGLLLLNQMRDASAVLEEALAACKSVELRCEVLSLLAINCANGGSHEKALEIIDLSESELKGVDNDRTRARVLHRIGIAALRLNLPVERVKATEERAAQIAGRRRLYGLSGHALLALANIALTYDDDASKETWYAQQAINAATKAGDRICLQTALLRMLNLESRRGNAERVKALENQLAQANTSDTDRAAYTIPARAYAASWFGRFDEAHRLITTVVTSSRLYDYDRAVLAASDAIFLAAQGQRDKAIDLVANTMSAVRSINAGALHSRRQVGAAQILCACAEALAGRHTFAHRILRKPTGDVSLDALRDAGLAICRALRNPASRDDVHERLGFLSTMGQGGIARMLGAAFESTVRDADGVESGLTESELQILKALSLGRTPKEIAQETSRSIYTIQTHIQNATRKLGCSGRSEALLIARTRGLIA